MPTDGKCVICGYRAPVSSFLGAAGNGELVPEFIKLPHVVQHPFYRYLALFRPKSGCACSDSKIIRLTREMVALVSSGYVSQQGKADRPCPPTLWAMGMERMMEQAAMLTLPMKNHNYLRSIVWQLADQADAGRERTQHHEVVSGEQRARRQRGDDEDPFLKAYKEKHGAFPSMPAEVTESLAALKRRLGQEG